MLRRADLDLLAVEISRGTPSRSRSTPSAEAAATLPIERLSGHCLSGGSSALKALSSPSPNASLQLTFPAKIEAVKSRKAQARPSARRLSRLARSARSSLSSRQSRRRVRARAAVRVRRLTGYRLAHASSAFPAFAYWPALAGFTGQRQGRFKDLPQAERAGWRLKAASLLLNPGRTFLITLNLADEEVLANEGKGHHLSRLAGEIRKALLDKLGSPSFVGVIELHHGRSGAADVNQRFGAHLHLLVQLDEAQLARLEPRLFAYLERAHGWAQHRQGLPPARISEQRRPGGTTELRLKLPGRTVGPGHLRTRTGLAANITPIDPTKSFNGRHGLEGALNYLAKDLHELDRRLGQRGLLDGAGEGRRRTRSEALFASDDIRERAEQLYDEQAESAGRDAGPKAGKPSDRQAKPASFGPEDAQRNLDKAIAEKDRRDREREAEQRERDELVDELLAQLDALSDRRPPPAIAAEPLVVIAQAPAPEPAAASKAEGVDEVGIDKLIDELLASPAPQPLKPGDIDLDALLLDCGLGPSPPRPAPASPSLVRAAGPEAVDEQARRAIVLETWSA